MENLETVNEDSGSKHCVVSRIQTGKRLKVQETRYRFSQWNIKNARRTERKMQQASRVLFFFLK
jgi:hypothetical protein